MNTRIRRWQRLFKCTLAAYAPNWLVDWLPYRIQVHSQADWNKEYSNGHWSYLNRSSELARYGTIASFCHFFSLGGPVLDHGCGEGILKQHLNAARYSQYLGVDLSHDAIALAMGSKADEKSQFEQGNVETFEPKGGYDVILFNEVLYYLKDPLATVMRYEPYLNGEGVIVVSMFDMMKSRKIWRQLDSRYTLAEASRAVNHGGHSWSIRVYRRSGAVA